MKSTYHLILFISVLILSLPVETYSVTQAEYDTVVNERDAVHAKFGANLIAVANGCLLYTSPSPRD